jgi:hypothetical protein
MTAEVWTFERVAAIEDGDVASVGAAMVWVDAELARATALAAAVIHKAEANGTVRASGHASAKGWLRGVTGCASTTATKLVQLTQAFDHLPTAWAAMRRGELSVDNAEVLVKLHRNRRITDIVEQHQQLLLSFAISLPHADWCRVAERFRAYVDPDGASLSHAEAREQRRVHAGHVGTEFFFDATGDNAAGVEIMAIYKQFVQAEFEKDRRAVGAGQKLPRTAAQRRFDAFHEMARAAGRSGTVTLPSSLVNFVIDEQTYLDALARAHDLPVPPRPPEDFGAYRSETTDGVSVDPGRIVYESVAGHVRRVVLDGEGVVINLGRKRRLFSGPARDAALLRYQHCDCPGCDVPASQCEVDHIRPWTAFGVTDAVNGRPLCRRHNHHKGPKPWDTS